MKSMNFAILEIDIDLTFQNNWWLTFCRFGISKNINANKYEILSNVTIRTHSKLSPLELIMELRFGRSTLSSYHFTITSHCQWTGFTRNKERIEIGLKVQGMRCYILLPLISKVLFLSYTNDSSNFPRSVQSPSVMDCNEGRSIQII